MTNRITTADLNALTSRLNMATLGTDKPAFNTPKAYTLDWAYGGVKLAQYTGNGGERDISGGGYGTKRELYVFMRGMLSGMGE